MGSSTAERQELAKLCSSRDWSKAIRILDSLLSDSCSIQDIWYALLRYSHPSTSIVSPHLLLRISVLITSFLLFSYLPSNRAFCYSQLELHKHVIKDCDKALQLDPTLLQAYILKGLSYFDVFVLTSVPAVLSIFPDIDLNSITAATQISTHKAFIFSGRALSALGKMDDAILVWEHGYKSAVRQSADLKQLMELEELLASTKQNETVSCNGHAMESSSMTTSASDSVSEIHSKSSDRHKIQGKSMDDNIVESSIIISSSPDSGPEVQNKATPGNAVRSKSTNTSEIRDKSKVRPAVNQKVSVTGIPKTKSISLDFRLSRGIAQQPKTALVNEGRYDQAISIFDQILRENPTSPEALIGRGTAYAFQRELDAAITDFTKAIESNPLAGEAWKRRGQARAALGESIEARLAFIYVLIASVAFSFHVQMEVAAAAVVLIIIIVVVVESQVQAIADLKKALEFEPNSSDILHERGNSLMDMFFLPFFDAKPDGAQDLIRKEINGIVNFKFKDYNASVEDLSSCVILDGDNKSAYTYLGLALSSIGEYKKAEEAHVKSIQLDPNFVEGWTHLAQFYQDLTNTEKALECLKQVLLIDERLPCTLGATDNPCN
ncbi:hypothetical protein ACLOJK_038207 [Asimina triloba]